MLGAQADVAVGAQREECDVLEAEAIGDGGFKISGLEGKLGIGTEREDCFKERRASDEYL